MQKKLNINESFICKIWDAGELYYSDLRTTDNEKVEVLELGMRNYDSGPDYKNARIRIGDKIFTGDVEVHRDFKGWAEHNHPKDRSYNTVILQVVLWDSTERIKPKLRIKRELPTVVLSKFLTRSIHTTWQEIIDNPSEKLKLPCYETNSSVSDDLINKTFEMLSIERLKLKTLRIKERIQELHKESGRRQRYEAFIRKSAGWEQLLYEFIFEALGYSKNKDPMMNLARNLTLKKINHIIENSNVKDEILIQALLYGNGGFLFDLRLRDEYISSLKEIWFRLKDSQRTEQINKAEWKFFRLRPQNFPTMRIAYGSQLILNLIKNKLFKEIILSFQLENFRINTCKKLLQNLFTPADDEYWSSHYDFGKRRSANYRLIGSERINDIIINVLIPIVYYYSIIFRNELITRNVLLFYNKMKIHPGNSVLDVVSRQILNDRNIKINSPAMEQAVVQLYNFYCMREKCGECAIGAGLVREKGYEYKIIFY